jgi:long-chain acyl-CoA synthetase
MTSLDPGAGNLGYWCSASAERFPGKIALIDLSRDPSRQTTYAALESRLDRVASTLTRLGLKAGDRLAMSIGNRIEFVEIMFGAMRAGIIPVPLNTRLGPDALRYVIEDSGCVGAVVETAANSNVPGIVESIGPTVRVMLEAAAPGGSSTKMRSPRVRAPSRRRGSRPIILPSCPILQARPEGPRGSR